VKSPLTDPFFYAVRNPENGRWLMRRQAGPPEGLDPLLWVAEVAHRTVWDDRDIADFYADRSGGEVVPVVHITPMPGESTGFVDYEAPGNNMYGCSPCPKCSARTRAPFRYRLGKRVAIERSAVDVADRMRRMRVPRRRLSGGRMNDDDIDEWEQQLHIDLNDPHPSRGGATVTVTRADLHLALIELRALRARVEDRTSRLNAVSVVANQGAAIMARWATELTAARAVVDVARLVRDQGGCEFDEVLHDYDASTGAGEK
jgi:hypothetical protein